MTGGGSFSLTSADVLSKTFDSAIASFNTPAPAAAAGTGGGAGGRRLAQTTSAAPAPSLVRALLYFSRSQHLHFHAVLYVGLYFILGFRVQQGPTPNLCWFP